MKKIRGILAACLALLMCLTCLPISAFAMWTDKYGDQHPESRAEADYLGMGCDDQYNYRLSLNLKATAADGKPYNGNAILLVFWKEQDMKDYQYTLVKNTEAEDEEDNYGEDSYSAYGGYPEGNGTRQCEMKGKPYDDLAPFFVSNRPEWTDPEPYYSSELEFENGKANYEQFISFTKKISKLPKLYFKVIPSEPGVTFSPASGTLNIKFYDYG